MYARHHQLNAAAGRAAAVLESALLRLCDRGQCHCSSVFCVSLERGASRGEHAALIRLLPLVIYEPNVLLSDILRLYKLAWSDCFWINLKNHHASCMITILKPNMFIESLQPQLACLGA